MNQEDTHTQHHDIAKCNTPAKNNISELLQVVLAAWHHQSFVCLRLQLLYTGLHGAPSVASGGLMYTAPIDTDSLCFSFAWMNVKKGTNRNNLHRLWHCTLYGTNTSVNCTCMDKHLARAWQHCNWKLLTPAGYEYKTYFAMTLWVIKGGGYISNCRWQGQK